MPQFLKQRYNETVAVIMAVFWLFLYVFINLTSILYLGSIAINNLVGGDYFHGIMIGLALFALIITLGGMKVIGYTDVIQVFFLIIGGLVATYLALTLVSEEFGLGKNVIAGLNELIRRTPNSRSSPPQGIRSSKPFTLSTSAFHTEAFEPFKLHDVVVR